MELAEVQQVLHEAECLYPKPEVEAAIDRLADATTPLLQQANPLVLGVMSGGVVLLGGLLTRWSFPLTIDYLHATRYRGAMHGGLELHWLARPHTPMQGRTVVVVDDILDGGQTLEGITHYCETEGAYQVISVVLVDKANPERAAHITADFAGLKAPNRFLFGYGMDYREYLRNAPGIFAVKGT